MTSYRTVDHIFISPDKGAPMQEVKKARALKGLGLEGDRYALQKGSWKSKGEEKHKPKRNLTIMSTVAPHIANNLRAYSQRFKHSETRRNVFVTMDVNELIGKEFLIGKVRCKGHEYAMPCERPSQLSGKEDFVYRFHGLGGVNCEILEDGEIFVGDEVKIVG